MMKIAVFVVVILGLLSSCCSVTVKDNTNPTQAVTAVNSKVPKRESSDQTAVEDKTGPANQQNYQQNYHQTQYQTGFVPAAQYYAAAASPQIQYVKSEGGVDYAKSEGGVHYASNQYRAILPAYQTLSYSAHHPSHAKLAAIQYAQYTPAQAHYADYSGHSGHSVQAASAPVQYAFAIPVAARQHHQQVAYTSAPAHHNQQIAYASGQAPVAYVQSAPSVQYAYAIQPQISQYLKSGGIHYATAPAAASNHVQQYVVTAAPSAHHNIGYAKYAAPQQFYYAAAPQYHNVPQYYNAPQYHNAHQGYAIAVQQQQQPSVQLASAKQVLTNSVAPAITVTSPASVQYKQAQQQQQPQHHQQHYIAAVPSAGPHNSATSFSTFSAHLPSAAPTAAAYAHAQYPYKSAALASPIVYATPATPAYHQAHHQPSAKLIYTASAHDTPVYTHPGAIHYGTHLYHPSIAKSLLSATPSPAPAGKY